MPEQLESIFDGQNVLITEGTDKKKGTGLGLVVSQRLAEKMKFVLSVNIVESNSTEFCLEIPYTAEIPLDGMRI